MSIATLMAASVLPKLLVVLKATAILVAAMLLAVALHRSSASVRHQVWLVALAGLLILPLIATYAPLGIRVLPAPAAVSSGEASVGTLQIDGSAGVVAAGEVPATDPARALNGSSAVPRDAGVSFGSSSLPIGTLLLGLWAGVTMVLLGRLLLGMVAVRRIVRGAEPLDDERWQDSLLQIADRLSLEQPPALLKSTAIHMPFAAGIRRPLIVLPAECERWSVAQREAVLIHELGHVRRKDMIGHTLGRIVCAFYWFHPLVWSAARRLRDASERACDDLAIRLGAIPSDYAQNLLDIVTKVRHPNTPTAAIAMARRKEFEGRMLAILDPDLHRGDTSRWRTALLSVGLAGFVLAVSAAAPTRREVPDAGDARLALYDEDPGVSLAPQAVLDTNGHQAAELVQPPPATAAARTPELAPNDKPETEPLVLTDQLLRQLNVPQDARSDIAGDTADEKMDLLIRVLRTDSSAKVRRVAAWGLQHYVSEPAAQTELARVLGNDANARVREMAAWALAQGRSDATLAALRRALASDQDEQVREVAVWGLGRNDDAAAAEAISRALAVDSSDRVRNTAAWALGMLRPERAPAALIKMLESDRDRSRLMAAWSLSEIGDRAALPAIRAALDQPGRDDATTRALLRAMVRSGATPEELGSFLSSANPEVRLFAIKAMTNGGGVDPWPWPWPRPIPIP